MRVTFLAAREEGVSHVAFMERTTIGMLQTKHRVANDPVETDATRGVLMTTLDTLASQLELFKACEGHYPDLIKSGWKPLIDGGYLKAAPVNPVNNSTEICPGPSGKNGFGWHWDERTGALGACFFDETSDLLTPDKP